MKQSCVLDNVEKALSLKAFDIESAQKKMMPFGGAGRRLPADNEPLRIGAVLLLLYCHDGELYLVLTRRRDDLPSHAGQISFPGGRQEQGETLLDTALRETEEEIGVAGTAVSPLGQLTPIYIPPSGFMVHPFIGWYQSDRRPHFRPSVEEVAEIIEVPLRDLLDPASATAEPWDFRGSQVTVPFFAVQGHKVWGATAIMLSEFVERLRIVSGAPNGVGVV
ncbi:MAG: CoA pyrophosphatase [Chloroflexi bacterium]|nr:CoA pyrophosphatase [Chloroflexota bacterium]MBP7041437.1 CoA pyrophosphatase [Chloroflexota bacterium]